MVIIVLAIVLILGVLVLSATYMHRGREATKSSKRIVTEVNLEQGETLMYRVEQQLEVRGGVVQKGTGATILIY